MVRVPVQGLAFDDGKLDLAQVELRFRDRPEVYLEPGALGQPCLHLGGLVHGVVVHHQVQLFARVGPGDLLEEGQELLEARPGIAGGP